MKKKRKLRCAPCERKDCRQGKDCFNGADDHLRLYGEEQIAQLHKAASAIEAQYYCKEPRLRETILFAKELGFRKIGLAFCIGLASEAEVIENILSCDFKVASVCCKADGIAKSAFGLEQISPENSSEVMCNPAGQAELLNQAQTEINISCGLCVGHDAIFNMMSKAPVTTLIVKDRVLAHNPIGAVYCQYIRRNMLPEGIVTINES